MAEYAQRDPAALEPHYSKHMQAMTAEGLHSKSAIAEELAHRDLEIERLQKLLWTPENEDFVAGVVREAGHQVDRWGVNHDACKEPPDWFWLIGYLAGKALRAAIDGNEEKAKHHCVSTAAVCANWHRRISGTELSYQPGHEPSMARAGDSEKDLCESAGASGDE